MVVLPDPPADLPPAARAFYDHLRTEWERLRPADVDASGLEIDFGDGGIGVSIPHAREPDWTVGAQVSRRAAVVFAGPLTRHFSDVAGGDWTRPAADLVASALRGELAIAVALRGHTVVSAGGEHIWSPGALALWRPLRRETVRMDFGARPR